MKIRYLIKEPMLITPRLLPGVRIGESHISIEYGDKHDGPKQQYLFHIDGEVQHSGDMFCLDHGMQTAFLELLGFLEHYSENPSDSMPDDVNAWLAKHGDDIYMVADEIESNGDILIQTVV